MSTWQQRALAGERWTKSEGRAAIAAWRASGESMASFAERHEIDAQRISWWRKRLEASDAPTTLVPVTIAAPRVVAGVAAAAVRVQVEDVEIVVHDPAQVSPEWLAALTTLIGKSAR